MRADKGRKDLLMPHWLPSDKNWHCIYIGCHHLAEPLPVSPHLGIYLLPCEGGGDCFTAEKIKVLKGLVWGCGKPHSLEKMPSQREESNPGREVGGALETGEGR